MCGEGDNDVDDVIACARGKNADETVDHPLLMIRLGCNIWR